jgi:hypothetical protein
MPFEFEDGRPTARMIIPGEGHIEVQPHADSVKPGATLVYEMRVYPEGQPLTPEITIPMLPDQLSSFVEGLRSKFKLSAPRAKKGTKTATPMAPRQPRGRKAADKPATDKPVLEPIPSITASEAANAQV